MFNALDFIRSKQRVLAVETIAKIRREHLVHGKSIKSIVPDRGVARNLVRKVLRGGETAFSYHWDVSRANS